MLYRLVSTACLIGLALSQTAAAQSPATCDCLWQGPFLEIIDRTDLIVSGEVVARKGNSMDVAIEQTLRDQGVAGEEFRPVIRVWGDSGELCRPELDDFETGSRWLLGLHKITDPPESGFDPNTPNVSFGRARDYYLSGCGVYWLKMVNDHASGPLVEAPRWTWQDKAMNPVRLELIEAYMDGTLPKRAIVEAAEPRTETKKLMDRTRDFMRRQQ